MPSTCGAGSTSTPSWASTSRVTQAAVLEALDGLPLHDHHGDHRRRWSPSSTAISPAPPCCCAATWTRCRCPRTRASSSRAASTARCTPAATTATSRCWPERPSCSRPPRHAGRSRGLHVPARRGGRRRRQAHARRGAARHRRRRCRAGVDGLRHPPVPHDPVRRHRQQGSRSLMASADTFLITVRGRGGHASMPHHAIDPIPIACEIVTAPSRPWSPGASTSSTRPWSPSPRSEPAPRRT